MGNQDWSNLGDQIKNTVQDAIDSQNFRQLNESIRSTVNNAMDNVNRSLNQTLNGHSGYRGDSFEGQGESYQGRHGNRHWDRTYRRGEVPPQNPWDTSRNSTKKNKKNELVSANSGMKGAGYSMSIVGFILSGGIGLALFILLMNGLLGGFAFGLKMAISVLLPFALGGLIMGLNGSRILKRLKRFRLYMGQIGSRSFCTVKELAGSSGKSSDFVVKDLRRMMQKNMFRQGHLDDKGTCFMLTDEVYNQYLEAQHQMELRQKEEQSRLNETKRQREAAGKSGQNSQDAQNKRMPEEVKRVIEEGQAYIRQIKISNDNIKGEDVSAKISRLEMITSKILERVQDHPENIPDLRKFMEYYLPTTVKLLDAYEKLDNQPVQGENILTSKREIEATLDTINLAFEKLYDGFFQDTSWDISSDISVLQTMFAQEGLSGQDFKTGTQGKKEEDGDIKLKF